MEDKTDSTRPLIGFPLGLALLLILLLGMSAFFYCCFHWERLRSLFISSPDDNNSDIEADIPNSPRKPLSPHKIIKRDESQSFSVLMPGDQVPKFIAMACPCRPPLAEKVTIEVHKPPTSVVPLR
ncbi:uncharacterized protein At5g65660 [Quercus suber]|uniref:Hydroxyproline-rich glycoprotein family protein n=1 Tax=Quercus suber TaxID=58331 RepID=A0AAW0KTA8_QUESU|nr:uncharacterized protein At5g65660-like [Quercus suber]